MVYVDKPRRVVAKSPKARHAGRPHGHLWCHMWADTPEELHEMAGCIGMKRSWFQDSPNLPHYDLLPPRRESALQMGAVEVEREELINAVRRYRDAKPVEAVRCGF